MNCKVIYLNEKDHLMFEEYLDFTPQVNTYIYPRSVDNIESTLKEFPYQFIVGGVEDDVVLAKLTDQPILESDFLILAKEPDYRNTIFVYLKSITEISLKDAVSTLDYNKELNSYVEFEPVLKQVSLLDTFKKASKRIEAILGELDRSFSEVEDDSEET